MEVVRTIEGKPDKLLFKIPITSDGNFQIDICFNQFVWRWLGF